jgi:hypothetical protein
MPIHDWTLVDAGLFHNFHQCWIVALFNALNAGVLPPAYFALVEQNIQGPIPDVLTLELSNEADPPGKETGGLAVSEAPPRTRVTQRIEALSYSAKANHITVRHRHGNVVAVIEIVSPGNKASRAESRAFIEKSSAFLRQGIHLLLVDLLPPGRRDPEGIHKLLWDEFEDGDFKLPPEKPLTIASYDAGPPLVAYVESIAVGDQLPEIPIFLKPEVYVRAPLESTYQTAWNGFPQQLRALLQTPGDLKG